MIRIILVVALVAGCAPEPPCQDQLCIQQRQINEMRRAALLDYSAKMLTPPPLPRVQQCQWVGPVWQCQ